MQQSPATIRKMLEGDRPLVLDSWCSTAARNVAQWVPEGMRARLYRRHMLGLLASSSVWVACNREAEDRILGWLCGDVQRGLVHWAWTREDWRRMGIMRSLVIRMQDEAGKALASTGWTKLGGRAVASLIGIMLPWPDCYRPDLGR